MASYDVASTIHQSLALGVAAKVPFFAVVMSLIGSFLTLTVRRCSLTPSWPRVDPELTMLGFST